ncbi:hypothetical protein FB45DRAFT_910393 [Roridomyces roridus]|uniref:Uncharacterized protein n=1 Tax=Roridomyces roridus TaxID=1738132 RepID=A0AAD7BZH8_9AGAR|nr:hypothetical protein FB45DRAFT_910393 [Roridomyces roridus]
MRINIHDSLPPSRDFNASFPVSLGSSLRLVSDFFLLLCSLPTRPAVPPPMAHALKTLVVLGYLVGLLGKGAAQAATEVTLWQFGQGRLLEASVTLPLIPLGTASDGSVTTFLYQALNNALVTTTDASGQPTTGEFPLPTSRTIIASASGWLEPFGTGSPIICSLVNPTFGDCVESGTIANTGAPTAEVLAIAQTSASPSITPPPTNSEPSSPIIASSSVSSSTSQSTVGSKKTSAGAIAGGVIGGLVLVLGCVAFLLWWRRRRRLSTPENRAPPPTTITPFNATPSRLIESASSNVMAERPLMPLRAGSRPSQGLAGHPKHQKNILQTTSDSTTSVGVQPSSSTHSTTLQSQSTATVDARTSTAVTSGTSGLEGQMVDIVDRLRRLEERGSVSAYSEPLPVYEPKK